MQTLLKQLLASLMDMNIDLIIFAPERLCPLLLLAAQ